MTNLMNISTRALAVWGSDHAVLRDVGIGIGVLIVIVLIMSASDVLRYLRIRRM